jgi:hypothetical protein
VAVLPALGVLALVLAVACEPVQPSAGRATPVRRVLVLGDSITFGLFTTTPPVHHHLRARLAARGVELRIEGFPGEQPLEPWPGNPRWADRLAAAVQQFDPDMVVIQSLLFPGGTDPARQAAYRTAIAELFDIARSRGAHVYTVIHQRPVPQDQADNAAVAQQLQAEAAAPRGISSIPLDWWLARCPAPFADGWHLTERGQECYADAVTTAVAQLQRAVG